MTSSVITQHIHPTNPYIKFTSKDIEQSITDRFEQQVLCYPDSLALKDKTQTFTYRELNQFANCVARSILVKSPCGNSPVALLMESRAMMVIAILGVLKAGKIWLSLNAFNPPARNTYILKDSQASVLITDNQCFQLAETLTGDSVKILNIDIFDPPASDDNVGLAITPDSLACILYTSGSTGEPKGVVHNHRFILHSIKGHTNALHICATDRLTLLSPLSHIAAVTAIFRALLNGASIFPYALQDEGMTNLAHWLIHEKITLYHSVPTVFRLFINTLTGTEIFANLRLIHLGGEPVTSLDLQLYKKHFLPGCLLLNNLGATEVGAYRQFFMDHNSKIRETLVPAGFPTEDKEVLLLDESGGEVGENCVGEITVISCFMAQSYWRKSLLTKEAFQYDAVDSTKRMYKTGDLGRITRDGCLVHIGRIDRQVKIRGFRVEIAEIEVTLRTFDKIKEAAITVEKDQYGSERLLAYVAPDNVQHLTHLEIRQFLVGRLPGYMIPELYVLLPSLPLTVSGKIDLLALPLAKQVGHDHDSCGSPPRTPLEEEIKNIWTDILNRDSFGITDNFFELGGQSITAMKFISRINAKLHVELPVRVVFECPTIASLAAFIENEYKGSHMN